MRITTKNYFKAINEVGFENLPDVLQRSHTIIDDRTQQGKDWGIYEKDADVKRAFDLGFEKLEEFIDRKEGLSGLDSNPIIERAKQDAAGYKNLPLEKLKMIYRLELDAELEDGLTAEIAIRKPALEKAIAEKEGRETPDKHVSPLEQKLIKRFLLLTGKTHQKKEIEGFLKDVLAFTKNEDFENSVLAKEILFVKSKLIPLVKSMGRSIKIELSTETKKRLQLALNKANAKPKVKKTLDGVEPEVKQESKPSQNLMNSIDFAKLHFNSIGFTGKWFDLIGDPSPGFTAMVFGRPKMGKSYLCVDLAGYLARHHGAVLYVANEEKLDATLQMKLNDKEVKHENLFVSDYLPEDLSKYQFIILDSVNKLGLSPKDLENLKKKNPGKSFIFVFQTTKDGKFKGANAYQHDVDVVIEVRERGRATQFGRFNQGGEIAIFDNVPVGETEELNGIRNPKKDLEVPKNVSNVATMKKKTSETKDWTEPQHLNKNDHAVLKEINRLYKAKKYKEAMNRAMETDTIVREEIPGDIWKKMGGQLTKTGEEKLRARQGAAESKGSKNEQAKKTIVFNSTVRALKEVVEREWDLELTDSEYIELLDLAQAQSVNFYEVVTEIHPNLEAFMTQIGRALKLWDKTSEKSKPKFDARNYVDRKDDDNPSFIFSLASSKVLAEALRGDFDIIYLVRRELANRGQDSDGKWVGFERAKEIHRIEK